MLENQITVDLFELLKDRGFSIKKDNEKLEISKFRRTNTILPRKIKFTENLLKSLFLIYGDGHYKSKLFMTNKNYRMHNFILDTFENELKINRNFWRLRIIHSQNENKKLMKDIKNYWLRNLQFEEKQIYPKISPSKMYKTTFSGIARIQIDKITYADTIRALIKNVENLILNDRLTLKNYCNIADAILNAEGSVLLDSQGIHRITISFNKDEKELFIKIFRKLIPETVLNTKRGDRITINGWKGIYPILKSFIQSESIPFSLRPKDSFNLISGFLNHKKTKALRNYLETLEKYPNKYFTQIARLSKRDWKSAKVTLQIRNKGFIRTKKVGGRYFTYVPNESKNLLKVIRTLEKWLPFVSKILEQDKLKFTQLVGVTKNVAN